MRHAIAVLLAFFAVGVARADETEKARAAVAVQLAKLQLQRNAAAYEAPKVTADAEGWRWDPVRQVHWRPLQGTPANVAPPAYLFSPPYPAGGWQGFSPPGGAPCPPGR